MLDLLKSTVPYQDLLAGLKGKHKPVSLGLLRAARLALVTALQQDLRAPILLLTDRADHALTLLDELGFWDQHGRRMLFPEPNPLFYEHAAWGAATRRDRIQVLTSLAVYHLPGVGVPPDPPVVIAPARAVMARTLPRRDFVKVTRLLKPGQHSSPEGLLRGWVDVGYEPVEIVTEPGQFSRRGGILDLWPPAESLPARLEFFGDEIDTIRRFDPASQRTVQSLEVLLVTPAREVLPGRAAEVGISPQDLGEFVLPLVYPARASLLDYLPANALVLVDDLDRFQTQVSEVEEQSVKFRRDSISEGILPEGFPIPYLSLSELLDSLSGHVWMDMGRSEGGESAGLSEMFMPGPRFGGRLKPFMEFLQELHRTGEPATIVSRQVSRLQELWQEQQPILIDGQPEPAFIEGTLSAGWIMQPPGLGHRHLLTDSEIFGWDRPQPRPQHRQAVEAPESVYGDLLPGDWVVHVDHGVGRFLGLVRRTLEGAEREFLTVEYEGGDQLFVPVHQADRLTRYIGPDGTDPSLTRLGGVEWTQSKEKVSSAVEEVAEDLLDLYAQRQVAVGYAFQQDSPWQQELEASFPYMETQDQLRAIREVKADMQRERPMDRLLCGDVGYGKTEVALRAAFKAVMDGKQVAILVPTTVLAQQHYDTFRQRLTPFPVVVEMLSRFRTAREQDEILKKLALGGIDIIIGTHRLVSADVAFKDLGLVIIDEEQRFGVTHKEHLKKLRTEVDVLTLTATPIPRTLYMALTGVRDISTINTPPEERLPIITHVGPYSPRLVRQAILRELERGGQVFFVHNRVQTIAAMRAHLNKLVPEARVSIAHGQMPEGELAQVMHRFSHGEVDVLLCTSIIESGLDIPNANTLIVDRGDTFGLAQLYQLRGRVGRGAQRAYAYFFRHKRKAPTLEGQERLEVIAENTQLGAGYSIAMRDLEMRGAGELLGSRQHGLIATVGFHLYTRLLAQAVRSQRVARGMPAESGSELLDSARQNRLPIHVDVPLAVGIPADYVADQNMRLRLYRRIAELQSEEELDAISEEFNDRFGALPPGAQNLLFQMKVKLRGERAGLASVSIENEQIVLRYPPLPEGMSSRNLPALGGHVRVGKNAYWVPFAAQADLWRDVLLDTLDQINRV